MTDDTIRKTAPSAKSGRKDRLAEQLRANLQRRKAQIRARRAGAADQRPDGLQPGPTEAGSASDQ